MVSVMTRSQSILIHFCTIQLVGEDNVQRAVGDTNHFANKVTFTQASLSQMKASPTLSETGPAARAANAQRGVELMYELGKKKLRGWIDLFHLIISFK